MLGFDSFGKVLMAMGVFLIIVGACVHFGSSLLPLGRLPGDFNWQKGNVSFHFPLVSSIIISIVLTLVINFFRR